MNAAFYFGRHRTTGRYNLLLPGQGGECRLEGLSRYQVEELLLVVGGGLAGEIRKMLERFDRVPVGKPVPGTFTTEDEDWPNRPLQ